MYSNNRRNTLYKLRTIEKKTIYWNTKVNFKPLRFATDDKKSALGHKLKEPCAAKTFFKITLCIPEYLLISVLGPLGPLFHENQENILHHLHM